MLKPIKDSTSASKFRPITLTGCLSKALERIINKKVMSFLQERNNVIDRFQCNVRSAWSIVGHLVRFETSVREAFFNKQQCLSIFFDMETAHDMVLRYCILRDFFDLGVRCRLLSAMQSYLEHRTFRVRLEKTSSKEFWQKNGIPQGVSVALFIVKLNSIGCAIPPSVKYFLCVDNLRSPLHLVVSQFVNVGSNLRLITW